MKAIVTMIFDDKTAQTYVVPPQDIKVIESPDKCVEVSKYRFSFECSQITTPYVDKDCSRAFERGKAKQAETSQIAVDNMFGVGTYEKAMHRLFEGRD